MDYKTIQLSYDSGVVTLTLNRPEKRNAISDQLMDELLRAFEEVATLTGASAHPHGRG